MKLLASTLLLISLLPSFAQDRPKVVVTLVVDQLKQEYLYRFAPYVKNSGWEELLENGSVLENVTYNYAPVYTGPGHASIFTGTTPSIHGIIENKWYDPLERRKVYCVEDSSTTPVGTANNDFKRSPKNLKSTTFVDELTLVQGDNKSFAISIKDRSAVLAGGHLSDGAFWLDDSTGNFASSSFYGDSLPQWLIDFNKREKVQNYMQKEWTLTLPESEYSKFGVDNSPFEFSLLKGESPTFPYDLKKAKNLKTISYTPYGNQILIDLAQELLKAEKLGQGNTTDFLAINLSSLDYVGHSYGPRSWEVMDLYIVLGQQIRQLINTLNKEVGKGNYLFVLTSDHGAAENSSFQSQSKLGPYPVSMISFESDLRDFCQENLGFDPILKMTPDRIYFNYQIMDSLKVSKREVEETIEKGLLSFDYFHSVYFRSELKHLSIDRPIHEKIINGYTDYRAGDVFIVLSPGFQIYGPKGTTHGSIWNHDSHVPVIFYGWKVKSAKVYSPYPITSIAPTLSFLLKTELPSGCFSKPIEELLKQ